MPTNKDYSDIGWLHDSGFAFYDVPSIWWKSVGFSGADCGLYLPGDRADGYELELLITKTGTTAGYPGYMCYASFRRMPCSRCKSADKPRFRAFMGCATNGGGRTPKEALDACMPGIKAQVQAEQAGVLVEMLPKLLARDCGWDYLPGYGNSKETAEEALIKDSRKYIAEFVEEARRRHPMGKGRRHREYLWSSTQCHKMPCTPQCSGDAATTTTTTT